MSATTPVSVIQDAVTGADLSTEFLTLAGVGIGVSIVVLAVKKGWRLVSSMIRA